MDYSSINFHDNFCLHFLLNFSKKWRKMSSWKFTDELSVKYLWIHKWTRWIRPKRPYLWKTLQLFPLITLLLKQMLCWNKACLCLAKRLNGIWDGNELCHIVKSPQDGTKDTKRYTLKILKGALLKVLGRYL